MNWAEFQLSGLSRISEKGNEGETHSDHSANDSSYRN